MATPQPRELGWLFLDLNSYFASVEQELRPELRGKPVAVVPMLADSTCCIAASYEAKNFGVRTGTQVSQAKKLCPGLILVEGKHRTYIEYHHKVIDAVETCLPVTTVASIDEVACRLIGSERSAEKAVKIAQNIKQAIYRKAGSAIKCSIGIAPNRFLAKVATDLEKPDGLVVIKPSDLPQALYTLEPADIPGIGHQMQKRLERARILTMEKRCALSKVQMKALWGGVWGERMWHWFRGDDFEEPPTTRRSISHSHVLPPEMRNLTDALAVLQKLSHKVAMRLRKMNYWAGGMAIYLRFIGRPAWSEQISMRECQDTTTILKGMLILWKRRPEGKILAVGVALFDLVPGPLHNLSLFDDSKPLGLSLAMDKINFKYGTDTVYFAGMHGMKAAAPTRIAFTSIPDYF